MRSEVLQSRRVAYLALFTGLAILFGYVESLIPLSFGIPGVKPGLCNIVILLILLRYSWKEALPISVARVLVIGFLFGSLYSIIYGLAGTALSILIMNVLISRGRAGLIGISAAGGVAHNIGQLLIAKCTLPSLPLFWYMPILLLAGVATGSLVGWITYQIYRRVKKKQGEDL